MKIYYLFKMLYYKTLVDVEYRIEQGAKYYQKYIKAKAKFLKKARKEK